MTRRVRAAAVAGSIAVVAGLGIGIAVGLSSSGGRRTTSPVATGPVPTTGVTGGPTAPTAACPASPPRLVTPGSAGGLPGRDAPLFDGDVTTLTICIYPVTRGAVRARGVSGPDAAALVARIDALPNQVSGACPADMGPTVLLIPAGDGQVVVGTAGGCGQLTNGTGTRFGRALLQELAGG